MFHTPGECPATHDPGVHAEIALAYLSQENCDFPQRSVLVYVRYRQENTGRMAQEAPPFRFIPSLAVKIELVGLVNQLESSGIHALFNQAERYRSIGGSEEIVR